MESTRKFANIDLRYLGIFKVVMFVF